MAFSQKSFLVPAIVLILITFLLRLFIIYQPVSNYPFNITYSESNRIYESYQVYAPLLAENRQIWPWMDPGRAILEGAIWLLPQPQIWVYRFWVATLSVLMSLVTAAAVVWRFNRTHPNAGPWTTWGLILMAWGTVFLSQGPVYPHLLLAILPVLLFFDLKSPWKTTLAVIVGSLWAGLTRVNWYLMPALVAFVLYALETKADAPLRLRWLNQPILWGILGGIASITVAGLSLQASGMPFILDPVMNYAYFKSKLYPNGGFAPGLLLGIALVSLPGVLVVLFSFWKSAGWARIRIALVLASLGGLLAGGTYVSLRAGGGYDLHNYDAYLTILFITVVILGLQHFDSHNRLLPAPVILTGLTIVPLFIFASQVSPPARYDAEQSNQTVAELGKLLHVSKNQGANILMMDHRPLVLMQSIQLELRPEYDKTIVMEMAMANNRSYLQQFHQVLDNREYDVIVAQPMVDVVKKPGSDPYWYENNVWVDAVVYPMMRNYEAVYKAESTGVVVYAAPGFIPVIQQALEP